MVQQYGTSTMDDVIKYLMNILGDEFSRDISTTYYGDIGTYPPTVFSTTRKDSKAVLVLIPMFNRPVAGERVASREIRTLGVKIVVLVNITPFFEAQPKEAYGEQILVKLATAIEKFLTNSDNETLKNRVLFTRLEDIDFSYQQRGDLSLRAAAINFEADVSVPR